MRLLQCGYAESKRNVLRRILNVLTDGAAVRQFSGREFQSLGAATEKRRAAVSKLCGRTDRSFCVDDRSNQQWGVVMWQAVSEMAVSCLKFMIDDDDDDVCTRTVVMVCVGHATTVKHVGPPAPHSVHCTSWSRGSRYRQPGFQHQRRTTHRRRVEYRARWWHVYISDPWQGACLWLITLHYIRKLFIVAWVRVTSRTTMAM